MATALLILGDGLWMDSTESVFHSFCISFVFHSHRFFLKAKITGVNWLLLLLGKMTQQQCCICDGNIIGYGNNAEPYKEGNKISIHPYEMC
jgi:hypothetical protein